MEDIRVPMSRGSMDDIGDVEPSQGGDDTAAGDTLSTQGARAIYEREARISIDYRKLSDDYKDVSLWLTIFVVCSNAAQ